MNNEYLWDTTGDHAEIKRLEETLAVFRYQETPAPFLADAKVSNNGWSGWRISFGFAFAACMALAIGGGYWLWKAGNFMMPEKKLLVDKTAPDAGAVPDQDIVVPELPSTPVPVEKHESQPITMSHRSLPRKSKKTSGHVAREQPVKLTADEKKAYDQLLLALSITGSNLKIVQDKVNGVEAPKHENEKNR